MPKPKRRAPAAPRADVPVHRFAIGSAGARGVCPSGDVPCVAKSTPATKRDKVDVCAADARTGQCSTGARAQSGIRTKTTTTRGKKSKELHISEKAGCTATMAKGDKCRLQLGFDQGQAFLRACSTGKGKGYRIDVTDPQDAHKVAKLACAKWRANGRSWAFLKGMPLGRGAR